MISRLKILGMLFLVLLFAGGTFAQAPLVTSATPVTMTLIGAESLTVACTPAGVTFAAAPGTAVAANVPISCVVTWNLAATRTSLTGYAGVAVATTALANGTTLIPSSSLSASFNGGAGNPCTSTIAAATPIGAGAACGANISGNLLSNNFQSTKTDSIALTLTEPTPLIAGNYTGNLLIAYVAI